MALVKSMATLALAVGVLGVVKGAQAQEPLPAGFLEAQVNERGQHCESRAQRAEAKRLLLACGAAGVWEIALGEAAPRFVRSYDFGAEVVGFMADADGRLWVKLQVLEARPFASAGSAAPGKPSAPSGGGAVEFPDESHAAAAPEADDEEASEPKPATSKPPPAGPAEPGTGRVTRSLAGEVVISLGSVDGIVRNDRIELALERGDDGSGDDVALPGEVLAIGVVSNVGEHGSRVRLGINERVPVGALATRTRTQPTASLSAPPRVGSLWALELTARPFAVLGELGAGMLLSGSIGRRFAGALHLRFVVDPLAIADVADKDSVDAENASFLVSYDSQFFEMGLGLGAQTVNSTDFIIEPGSGLAASQLIRLGAQDGLNLSARTSIVLFHSEFAFGGMIGQLQIPVGRGYWLLLGGGGGNVGYGYGEFGLRALLSGNGHAGSKFLLVTAGGAGVFRSDHCSEFACQNSASYSGPMAGLGGEWRF